MKLARRLVEAWLGMLAATVGLLLGRPVLAAVELRARGRLDADRAAADAASVTAAIDEHTYQQPGRTR